MQKEDWTREEEAELKAAKNPLAHGHWSWCSLTFQQVAEKAFEAVGENFRQNLIGNNLNLPLSELQTFANIPESVRQACGRPNQYCTPTSYPNAFDRVAPVYQFFESDGREAMRDAGLVFEFARSISCALRYRFCPQVPASES
jgi:HEPN domain-containing protein